MVSKFSACCRPTDDTVSAISEEGVSTERTPKLEGQMVDQTQTITHVHVGTGRSWCWIVEGRSSLGDL